MHRPTDLILQRPHQFKNKTLQDFFWRTQDWLNLRGFITNNSTGLGYDVELNSFISSTQDVEFFHKAIVFDRQIPAKQHKFGPSQIVGTLSKYLLLKPKQTYTAQTALSTYNKTNTPALSTSTYNKKPYYQSRNINILTEDNSIEIDEDIMDAAINVLQRDPKQVDVGKQTAYV